MRKSLLLPLALAAATLPASPALADEPYAVTPSGRTEAIFDLGVTDTSDKIANGCADMGWTLVSSTSTIVTCEIQLGVMQSALAQLALGNSYSTPPKQYLRFNIAGAGRSSRVQTTGWIETQMAFGQVRTMEMTAASYHNNVMAWFEALGGRFPPGTTYPNHAYIGFFSENAKGEQGVRLANIVAGSPADRAGLQEGDVVTRLARERIKTVDDLLDGMRKAVREPTYELEVMRDGKTLKLTVEREFKAAVAAPALADLPPEPQPEAAQPAMALSTADELAKFAKLRDDGIITPAEFDAQKAKLLGLN